jgi:AcrR family transcriptional regulator
VAESVVALPPADGAHSRVRQAALDLFLEHGFHGTSMRQIARRAGISLAAIYNHIPSKEALFVELLSELVPHRGLVAAMSQAAGGTVEALINDATRRIGDALVENQVNMRLMFVELLEFKGRHAPSLAEGFLPGAGAFVTRLQEADGSLRPYPPVLVARAFFGLVMSYAVSVAFFKDIPLLEFGPEDLKNFGNIFLHGILDAEASGDVRSATG